MNSRTPDIQNIDATLSLIIDSGIYRHNTLRKQMKNVFCVTGRASDWDGLKTNHWEILYYLIECRLLNRASTISDVPRGTNIPPTTGRRLLRSLEDVGLITTVRNGQDKRRFETKLASEYHQVVDDFVNDYTDEFSGLIQKHDKRERDAAIQEYKKLFDTATAGIGRTRISDGKILLANNKMAQMFGYDTVKEFIDDYNFADHYTEINGREKLISHYRHYPDETYKYELTKRDGTEIHVQASGHLEEKYDYIAFVVIDITDQIRAENSLRESEQRFKSFTNTASDWYWEQDAEFRFTFVSATSKIFSNMNPEQHYGKKRRDLNPLGVSEERMIAHEKLLEERQPFSNFRYYRLLPNGKKSYLSISGQPFVDENGEFAGYRGTGKDISEQIHTEKKLQKALMEKETLVSEIHHRVKNNLQMISSMLMLQANTEINDRSREALVDSQRRIGVMARIHDSLHQSDNLSAFSAKDYFIALVQDMKASVGNDAGNISFRVDVEDVIIEADQVIPCGQIVNELTTNSIKHAFSNGGAGEVSISLHRTDAGMIELIIADNGKGISEGFDVEQADSLGMKLVHVLTKQLEGTISLDGSNGTRYQITFPEKPS